VGSPLGVMCQKLRLRRVNYKHISGLTVKDKHFGGLVPSGFRLYCCRAQVPPNARLLQSILICGCSLLDAGTLHYMVVFVVLPLRFT